MKEDNFSEGTGRRRAKRRVGKGEKEEKRGKG